MSAAGGVAGIVLVAGKSERMVGAVPKQLLRFGDLTMAALVVATAEASQLDRVVVVTGRESSAVRKSLVPGRAMVVDNPDYERGNVTSLLRGVAAAGDPDAIVLLLGDMPGVTTDVVNRFVATWRRSAPWAAVAAYADGVPKHPFMLSEHALTSLPVSTGSKALWTHLVEAPPEPVTVVSFDRPAPVDVDTPAEYQAALDELGLLRRSE